MKVSIARTNGCMASIVSWGSEPGGGNELSRCAGNGRGGRGGIALVLFRQVGYAAPGMERREPPRIAAEASPAVAKGWKLGSVPGVALWAGRSRSYGMHLIRRGGDQV